MIQLSAEEQFLWDCALTWRDPRPPEAPEKLDWSRIVSIARANKMATLLGQVLGQTGLLACLPPAAGQELDEAMARLAGKAADYRRVLGQYMPLAWEQGLETIPLKGLWVSSHVYGNPTMRPGHDMDILVRRGRVADCIAILERLGFGRYWPQQLADAFYQRHHLHLELCLSDCWTWVEIHWAFDHPRTRLTIDYEAVLNRARPGELLGVPVWDPSPPDLLLYLAVHLVKHAVYLPAVLDRPELPRLILADGRLMYFLDLAEAVKVYREEIDWQLVIALARAYGAVDILGAVLRVCHDILGAPVPEEALAALPVARLGPVTRRLMNRVASHTIATYLGRPASAFWHFLLAENTKFVVRPVRLLDFATYAAPGRNYLQRRYGRATAGAAASHLARTLGEYTRLGLDTVAFTWQRRRRPLPVFMTRPEGTG
ncbi:MAG: nucleotidyltransferase family protein [Chloroflexi bacterium]|nr:nucleotidyltransferase family protein [Chloroflexota bacterium]MCI0643571.1 nucleotidyltransferase family protein [Chloroflexota bacterium]